MPGAFLVPLHQLLPVCRGRGAGGAQCCWFVPQTRSSLARITGQQSEASEAVFRQNLPHRTRRTGAAGKFVRRVASQPGDGHVISCVRVSLVSPGGCAFVAA